MLYAKYCKNEILFLCETELRLLESLQKIEVDVDLPMFDSEVSSAEDEDMMPMIELASRLLEVVPNLSVVRFGLVPIRMSENEFWARFFSLINRTVLEKGVR